MNNYEIHRRDIPYGGHTRRVDGKYVWKMEKFGGFIANGRKNLCII